MSLAPIYWMVQEKWNRVNVENYGSPAVEPLIANLIDWKKNPRPAVADALAPDEGSRCHAINCVTLEKPRHEPRSGRC